MCFALGAATTEQVKHLTASCAGPLAGLAVLPHLRTLRPRLAAVADAADPLALQEMAARAMLAADPVTSGVYYVDDHFVPYAGARPVAKGWNNKRGKAERGRADTHVTAHDGRAVCFVTGEPSGLTGMLPKALAELKEAAPPGAAIMLGFDRGGAYAQVFRHCRKQDVHWVSYRRASALTCASTLSAYPDTSPMLAFAVVSSLSLVTHQATRHGRPGFHPCNSGTPLIAITQRDPSASHPAPLSIRIVAFCETATVLPGLSPRAVVILVSRAANRPGWLSLTAVNR